MTTGQETVETSQSTQSEALAVPQGSQFLRVTSRADRMASSVFIMPAVLVVLFLAIFPLLISLYLSLSRFKFVKGGFEINFVGLANFQKLFLGLEKTHFLGLIALPSIVGWMVLASVFAL
jgi:multiple sugar transport system permease protein